MVKNIRKQNNHKSTIVSIRSRSKTRAERPRLIDDPAVSEKIIITQLRAMGLKIATVLGDGNCQFRSLSDQFYGSPARHLEIRHEICEYLSAHPDRYRSFVDEDSVPGGFEGHVQSMRRAGTYGTHIELVAFAHLFKRSIKVVQPGLVYVIDADDQTPLPPPPPPVPPAASTSKMTIDQHVNDVDHQIEREARGESSREGEVEDDDSEVPVVALSDRDLRLQQLNERRASGVNQTASNKGKGKLKMMMPVETLPTPSPTPTVSDEMMEDEIGSTEERLGPLYIVYHSWEHYSSVRNISGPHSGLPNIREIPTAPLLTYTPPINDTLINDADKLLLASLPSSLKATPLAQIKAIISCEGSWEAALEFMLEQEAKVTATKIAVTKKPRVVKVKASLPPLLEGEAKRSRGRPRKYPLLVPVAGISSESMSLDTEELKNRLKEEQQIDEPVVERAATPSYPSTSTTTATSPSTIVATSSHPLTKSTATIPILPPTIDSLRRHHHRARSPSCSGDDSSESPRQRSRHESPATSISPSIDSVATTNEASSIDSPLPVTDEEGDAEGTGVIVAVTARRLSRSTTLNIPVGISSKKQLRSGVGLVAHHRTSPRLNGSGVVAKMTMAEQRAERKGRKAEVQSTRRLRRSGLVAEGNAEAVVGRVRELHI